MLEKICSDSSLTFLYVVAYIMSAIGFIILAYGIPYNIKVLRVIGWTLVWTAGAYGVVMSIVYYKQPYICGTIILIILICEFVEKLRSRIIFKKDD